MHNPFAPFFGQSGTSPTPEFPVPGPAQTPPRHKVARQVRRADDRLERMPILSATAAETLSVVFEPHPTKVHHSRCRECGAEAFLTIFRRDNFDRVQHLAYCHAGRALSLAAKISEYERPTHEKLQLAVKLLREAALRIVDRLAAEAKGGAR